MARRAKKGEGAFISQCGLLAAKWDGLDPATIGLTTQFVGAFGEKAQAARAAAEEALRAKEALAQAMQRKRLALEDLRTNFAAATGRIEAEAKTTGDEMVYVRAGIRKRDKPGRLPAPPTPTMRRPRLLHYGPIELRFTPSGEAVQYEVQRSVLSLDGRYSPWELLTITGHKRVRDRKVPRGVASVRYRVRARRTTGKTSGWSNPAEVSFGCSEGACAVLGGAGEGSAGGGVRAA